MRTARDTLLSLKRYTAEVLGSEWEVRLWQEDGAMQYPFARVASTGSGVTVGSRQIAEVTNPFSIHCYPADPNEMTLVQDAIEAALDVEERLYVGFEVGVGLGRKRRVPLYDYAGLSLNEAASERNAADYLLINDFSVGRMHDPEDERGVAVVATLRASWRRLGLTDFHRDRAVPSSPGKLAQSGRIRFDGR